MKILEGKIRYFNQQKGFGFIIPDDGGTDVFVHVHDIEGEMWPNEGERVTYTLEVGQKGPRARDVRIIGRVYEKTLFDPGD